ncbi:MFS transporter [Enhydrobacter sp.]|jgi:predicted MFS family arabinose efflux permease|uniref:MFS transporter n=1 Tax=Enhydrobacter sp. TaxID=1894999 RepID=UPI002614CE96|nr:MFS transporter [Enhydrobacter sp.]WIM09162.1 MAG: putative MFS-type transporter [Enhydrobacter sp.]
MNRSRLSTIVVLGSTQTLAWASSYYLPAVLADPIAHDTGVSTNWLFGIFSGALIISALLGPRMGRMSDAGGGNRMLAGSNLLFTVGLVLLAFAHSMPMLAAAWLVLGVGMGFGLYDAAFAVLGRIYGTNARGAITGITLIAGFASTVGWPLTAWGAAMIGWRDTCLAWAALHLFVALPLNYWALPRPTVTSEDKKTMDQPVPIDRPMILLGFAFAAAWIVTAGMAAHFPRILEATGASQAQAIAAGALIGPAQVGARMLEASFLARFHPLVSARLATLTHPIGAAVILAAGGGVAASAFAVLHGAGNGIITIARGTVPLAIFGPVNYGYRLGILGMPARFLSAAAPLGFALLIEQMGTGILVVSSALSLAACGALCLLRRPAGAAVHAD